MVQHKDELQHPRGEVGVVDEINTGWKLVHDILEMESVQLIKKSFNSFERARKEGF